MEFLGAAEVLDVTGVPRRLSEYSRLLVYDSQQGDGGGQASEAADSKIPFSCIQTQNTAPIKVPRRLSLLVARDEAAAVPWEAAALEPAADSGEPSAVGEDFLKVLNDLLSAQSETSGSRSAADSAAVANPHHHC